jgi:GAF domain-containing protein
MADQQRLIQTLVRLADTLVDDYDVIEFMQTLAERSVELLDVSAAGIMLADGQGGLRHAACSDEQMRLVELFELQLEEGPCFDAFRTQRDVRSGTAEDVAARWPRFAEHARGGGFIAVSAVPMRLRGKAIGALNLF